MKRATIAVLVLAASCMAAAEDIRDMVKAPEQAAIQTTRIDPDSHIFGIPFGTSEEDFFKRFGKPDGYVRFSGKEAGMLYGKSILFLFDNKQLSGVRLTHTVLDWKTAERMVPNPVFDGISWRLTNGIQAETSLKDVMGICGGTGVTDKYHYSYTTTNAVVSLDLSHYTDRGDGDDAYKVCGITVEKK